MIYENALNIYTDGSSFSNPRRGGIGIRFIIIDSDALEKYEDLSFSGYQQATNNEMELLACIKAIECAPDNSWFALFPRIHICTDSKYVCDNVNRAKFQWPNQKWRSALGRPIENATMWKDLMRLLKGTPKRIEFHWVKGHSKDIHNKAVDKLAKTSAKGHLYKPLKVQSVRRKVTKESVEIGCVPMQGQELSIRVITDQFMSVQRIYKYKYETILSTSGAGGKVDIIFSRISLRAGHKYLVKVNDVQENPQILELIRELAAGAQPV